MSLRTSLLATTILFATATPALAADHLMKVGEVLLSKGGSTASQYIELQDPGEPFPSPPYSLHVYDANGAQLGMQVLSVPASTTRLLVATAQAQTDFSVTANAILTTALPINGQACFERAVGRIHCFHWGTIASVVLNAGGIADAGATPPDGMSVQFTSAGYIVGTPTPGQPNITPPMSDAGVTDAPSTVDAAVGHPDAPVNGESKDSGGCSVAGGGSWLALVGLALLGLVRVARRRR